MLPCVEQLPRERRRTALSARSHLPCRPPRPSSSVPCASRSISSSCGPALLITRRVRGSLRRLPTTPCRGTSLTAPPLSPRPRDGTLALLAGCAEERRPQQWFDGLDAQGKFPMLLRMRSRRVPVCIARSIEGAGLWRRGDNVGRPLQRVSLRRPRPARPVQLRL